MNFCFQISQSIGEFFFLFFFNEELVMSLLARHKLRIVFFFLFFLAQLFKTDQSNFINTHRFAFSTFLSLRSLELVRQRIYSLSDGRASLFVSFLHARYDIVYIERRTFLYIYMCYTMIFLYAKLAPKWQHTTCDYDHKCVKD